MSDSTFESAPVITLSNGLRVANFSSAHPFTFEDGSILPACSEARSRAFTIMAIEEEFPTPHSGVVDIQLSFELDEASEREMLSLEERHREIDVVIVPLPVLQAWKKKYGNPSFFRTVRTTDRVKKLACINKFCV